MVNNQTYAKSWSLWYFVKPDANSGWQCEWATPLDIDGGTQDSGVVPSLAAESGSSGGAHILWTQTDCSYEPPETAGVFYTKLCYRGPNQTGVSILEDWTRGGIENPKIAMAPNTHPVAAYRMDGTTSTYVLTGTVSGNTTNWVEEPVPVSNHNAKLHGLSINTQTGWPQLIYDYYDAGTSTLSFIQKVSSSNWSQSEPLGVTPRGNVCGPFSDALTGDVSAMYCDTSYNIQWLHRNGGTWNTTEMIAEAAYVNTNAVSTLRGAIDTTDNTLWLLWVAKDGNTPPVYYQILSWRQ